MAFELERIAAALDGNSGEEQEVLMFELPYTVAIPDENGGYRNNGFPGQLVAGKKYKVVLKDGNYDEIYEDTAQLVQSGETIDNFFTPHKDTIILLNEEGNYDYVYCVDGIIYFSYDTQTLSDGAIFALYEYRKPQSSGFEIERIAERLENGSSSGGSSSDTSLFFVVSIQEDRMGAYTSDKTYAEIVEAFESGKICILKVVDKYTYGFMYLDSDNIYCTTGSGDRYMMEQNDDMFVEGK